MSHPLVEQLRFARSEFVRGLDGVSADDACHRFEPMNCISWIVGHLANQEHRYWVLWSQGRDLAPGLNALVGYGQPASVPPLDEMWSVWHRVTAAADVFLDGLAAESLPAHMVVDGESRQESIGTMLLRNTYHYWYHLGEGHAIRQMLGHVDLPQFVGDVAGVAYCLEQ
jgi:hypothetical protein